MSLKKALAKAEHVTDQLGWEKFEYFKDSNFDLRRYRAENKLSELERFLIDNSWPFRKSIKCDPFCVKNSDGDHSDFCPVPTANFTLFSGGMVKWDAKQWKETSSMLSDLLRLKVKIGKLEKFKTVNPICIRRWDSLNEKIKPDKPFAFYMDFDGVMEEKLDKEEIMQIAATTCELMKEICSEIYLDQANPVNVEEYSVYSSQKQEDLDKWKNGIHIYFAFWAVSSAYEAIVILNYFRQRVSSRYNETFFGYETTKGLNDVIDGKVYDSGLRLAGMTKTETFGWKGFVEKKYSTLEQEILSEYGENVRSYLKQDRDDFWRLKKVATEHYYDFVGTTIKNDSIRQEIENRNIYYLALDFTLRPETIPMMTNGDPIEIVKYEMGIIKTAKKELIKRPCVMSDEDKEEFIQQWEPELGSIVKESITMNKAINPRKLSYELHYNFRVESPKDGVCSVCNLAHLSYDYRFVQLNRSTNVKLGCVKKGGTGYCTFNKKTFPISLWSEELPKEFKLLTPSDMWKKPEYQANLIEYDAKVAIPLSKFDPLAAPEITVQQSGMGSQKTRGTVRFLQESRKSFNRRTYDENGQLQATKLRVISLVAGRPLSVKLSSDFQAWNYMNGYREADDLCVTMESLTNFCALDKLEPYHVLIIDEAKKFIENFTSDTLKSTSIRATYEVLLKLFATSQRIILLDADAHLIYDTYHKLFLEAYAKYPHQQRHKLTVQLNLRQRNPYDYYFGTSEQLEYSFKEDVVAGKKVAAICMTRQIMYKLMTSCVATIYKVNVDTPMKGEEAMEFNKKDQREKLNHTYNDFFELDEKGEILIDPVTKNPILKKSELVSKILCLAGKEDKDKRFPKACTTGTVGAIIRDAICKGNKKLCDFIFKNIKVIIHTPIWPVGISLEDLNVDAIYVFVDRSNILTHIEIMQQIARYRVESDEQKVPVYVGWSNLNNLDYYETDPKEIKNSLEYTRKHFEDQKENLTDTYYRFLLESKTFDQNDPLLDHLVNITASKAHSYNNLRNFLKTEIIKRGAYFEELDVLMDDKEIRKINKKNRIETEDFIRGISKDDEDYLKLIQEAPEISKEKYDELKWKIQRNEVISIEERAQYDSHRICSIFNIDKSYFLVKNGKRVRNDLVNIYVVETNQTLASEYKKVFVEGMQNDRKEVIHGAPSSKIQNNRLKLELFENLLSKTNIKIDQRCAEADFEEKKANIAEFIDENIGKLRAADHEISAKTWKMMKADPLGFVRKICRMVGYSFNKEQVYVKGKRTYGNFILKTPYNNKNPLKRNRPVNQNSVKKAKVE